MPWTQALCPDETICTFNQCLACDHECFDLEVREALFEHERNWQTAEHTGDHITATALLGCLRSTYLERITYYAANPESQWYSLRGQLIHRLVERPDMDNPYVRRSEMRLSAELDGMTISGQVDNYKLRFLKDGVLKDWKSIGDNGLQYIIYDGAKEEHIWQTNIYAWLLRRNGYSVRKVEIAYLSLMQIIKTGALATFNEYVVNAPTKAGKRKHMIGSPQLIKEYAARKKWRCIYRVPEVPLFDDPTVEEFIRPRLATLRQAFDNGLMPPMAPEEIRQWKCDGYCQVKTQCDQHENQQQEPRPISPPSTGNVVEIRGAIPPSVNGQCC